MSELIERPDWLPDVPREELGTGDLAQYIVPPRIKVVQAQSGEPYDAFDAGDVIMAPQLVKLCDKKGSFNFVPIFFFAEWCLWNPLEMKGSLNAIRERTLDPKDPMVAKCRDPKQWEIPCPENNEFSCRYCEHLNFVVAPLVQELNNTPCVLTFARGEHTVGRTFSSLIQMRSASKYPLYVLRFEATVGLRKGQKGQWYGVNCANPTDGTAFVTQEQFELFKGLHEEYRDAHAKSLVQVDYASDEEAPAPDTGEF